MRGLFYMQDSEGYKNHGLETIYIRITNCIFDYMVAEGLNKKYKGKNSAMMDTSNKITITESDIRKMAIECLYRVKNGVCFVNCLNIASATMSTSNEALANGLPKP